MTYRVIIENTDSNRLLLQKYGFKMRSGRPCVISSRYLLLIFFYDQLTCGNPNLWCVKYSDEPNILQDNRYDKQFLLKDCQNPNRWLSQVAKTRRLFQ